MLQDASTFRPVINGSNLGLYKTALIAAPHRQLRRTAVDGAATRLRCRNSTAAPQLDCGAAKRRLLRRRNSTAVKAPKSSPIIDECCCKRGMPQ